MANEINGTALQVYQQLLTLGVAPGTAAGAVGSLMGESGKGLNTAALNRGDGADGSDSIGMGQWNQSRAPPCAAQLSRWVLRGPTAALR